MITDHPASGKASFKVACIGAGYFSQFHYEAWRRINGVQLVASVDINIDSAKATGLSAYDDVQLMLDRESPDIVDIILPPTGHLSTLSKVIETGCKLIICQKPFCLSVTEAEQASALAASAGIPLLVHENIRFSPWNRVIKQQIEDGVIGKVLQMTFRLRPGDGQGAQAYLERQPYFQTMERFLVHETAVHWIDTFRFLLGSPESVFADLRKLNPTIAGEDAGYILFYYADGVRAMFDGNRLLDHAAVNHRCTMGEALVEGTEGTLKLLGNGEVWLRRFGAMDETQVLGANTSTNFGGDCVYHLQQHAVNALGGEGKFENLASDYLEVIRTEEKVYESSERGQKMSLRG